jgi:hypothetical protein
MTAVVRKVIDTRSSAAADVQSNDGSPKHALQVVRDEAIAATDVEHVGAWRKHTRDFKRHVVCSSNFSSASHAVEATFDCCG